MSKLTRHPTLMVSLAAAALATVAVAPASFAADPVTPQQASTQMPVPSTSEFLTKVAAGNKFEIDSSKLAQTKSKSETVLSFAKMMVTDHGDAAIKFKQAITDAKLTAPADKPDAKHQAILDDLAKKDGPAFDKAYIEAQTTAHQETVALFQAYAKSGDNTRMKQFAHALLPTLQKHLDHVTKLKS
ncbi:MAG: hypothetical protein JWQ58_1002 [Reyranella sp.]|nr:hypothetical protein [Reyranella sp.]